MQRRFGAGYVLGKPLPSEDEKWSFLEKIYSDYEEMNTQQKEIAERRRQLDMELYEGNVERIEEILQLKDNRGDARDGDWDTYAKVEQIVKKFVYCRTNNIYRIDEVQEALEERIRLLTETEISQKQRIASLEEALSNVQTELAQVTRLLCMSERRVKVLKSESVVNAMKVRQLRRMQSFTAGAGEKDESQLQQDMRILMKVNREMEKDCQHLRIELNMGAMGVKKRAASRMSQKARRRSVLTISPTLTHAESSWGADESVHSPEVPKEKVDGVLKVANVENLRPVTVKTDVSLTPAMGMGRAASGNVGSEGRSPHYTSYGERKQVASPKGNACETKGAPASGKAMYNVDELTVAGAFETFEPAGGALQGSVTSGNLSKILLNEFEELCEDISSDGAPVTNALARVFRRYEQLQRCLGAEVGLSMEMHDYDANMVHDVSFRSRGVGTSHLFAPNTLSWRPGEEDSKLYTQLFPDKGGASADDWGRGSASSSLKNVVEATVVPAKEGQAGPVPVVSPGGEVLLSNSFASGNEHNPHNSSDVARKDVKGPTPSPMPQLGSGSGSVELTFLRGETPVISLCEEKNMQNIEEGGGRIKIREVYSTAVISGEAIPTPTQRVRVTPCAQSRGLLECETAPEGMVGVQSYGNDPQRDIEDGLDANEVILQRERGSARRPGPLHSTSTDGDVTDEELQRLEKWADPLMRQNDGRVAKMDKDTSALVDASRGTTGRSGRHATATNAECQSSSPLADWPAGRGHSNGISGTRAPNLSGVGGLLDTLKKDLSSVRGEYEGVANEMNEWFSILSNCIDALLRNSLYIRHDAHERAGEALSSLAEEMVSDTVEQEVKDRLQKEGITLQRHPTFSKLSDEQWVQNTLYDAIINSSRDHVRKAVGLGGTQPSAQGINDGNSSEGITPHGMRRQSRDLLQKHGRRQAQVRYQKRRYEARQDDNVQRRLAEAGKGKSTPKCRSNPIGVTPLHSTTGSPQAPDDWHGAHGSGWTTGGDSEVDDYEEPLGNMREEMWRLAGYPPPGSGREGTCGPLWSPFDFKNGGGGERTVPVSPCNLDRRIHVMDIPVTTFKTPMPFKTGPSFFLPQLKVSGLRRSLPRSSGGFPCEEMLEHLRKLQPPEYCRDVSDLAPIVFKYNFGNHATFALHNVKGSIRRVRDHIRGNGFNNVFFSEILPYAKAAEFLREGNHLPLWMREAVKGLRSETDAASKKMARLLFQRVATNLRMKSMLRKLCRGSAFAGYLIVLWECWMGGWRRRCAALRNTRECDLKRVLNMVVTNLEVPPKHHGPAGQTEANSRNRDHRPMGPSSYHFRDAKIIPNGS
uniref:Uncharacterized protein n=1 Tax=Trypanosoma congolense (strain IL3000) TaxID=1068625 RepID=G0UTK7_TRYCI|nr:conserved hypothetical protein [Trypanosoma congolense IL3000]